MSAPQRPPESGSNAGTWFLLVLVLAAIGAVGYFGFYKTGQEANQGKPPEIVPLTTPRTVPQAAPSASPTPFTATPPPDA